MRIEVAKALEGAIPDLAAKRVIDSQITPAFRAGDYAGGLNSAVDQLAALIRGEGLPEPDQDGAGSEKVWDNTWALMFFAFFWVAPLVVRLFGRRWGSLLASLGIAALGWWLTASLVVCVIGALITFLFAGLIGLRMGQRGWTSGGSSGGWGGSGGGGFSSGGGGDFGGGGASGRW